MAEIEQVDKDGNVITTYKSQVVASKETGISQARISNVCRGRATNANGKIFRFKDVNKRVEFQPKERKKYQKKPKEKIFEIGENGEILRTFDGIEKASEQTGISEPFIKMALRGAVEHCNGIYFRK